MSISRAFLKFFKTKKKGNNMSFKKSTITGKIISEPESFEYGNFTFNTLILECDHRHIDMFYKQENVINIYCVTFCGAFSTKINDSISVGSVCQVTGVVKEYPKDYLPCEKGKYMFGEEIIVLDLNNE